MTDKTRYRVVVDVKQRQPGCVLLQAAMGGNSAIVSELLMPEAWLIAPTGDMRLVEGTREEWQKFGWELTRRYSKRHKKELP